MLTVIQGRDLGSNSSLLLPSGKETRQILPNILFQTCNAVYALHTQHFFFFACFAVSVFLLDLRKIKFILLIKIMTLSLVLFSSVSTY